MADKAYCSRKFLRLIKRKGGKPFIPCKKTYKVKWEIDKNQYKKRNVVERFSGSKKIVGLQCAFLAFVLFASILLWLK